MLIVFLIAESRVRNSRVKYKYNFMHLFRKLLLP